MALAAEAADPTGFEHIAVVQVGDDEEGFLRFWTGEVLPRLQ